MIMKPLLAIFLATLCAATGHGQTLKSLMVNTNGNILYSGEVLGLTNTTFHFTGAQFYIGTNATGGFGAGFGIGANAFTINDVNGSPSMMLGTNAITFYDQLQFSSSTLRAQTRTNLGLGATNSVEFRNITSDGNIVITNQTATNNGILFVYRTNNEPFLGLANLIASNNTTISNETLFRVGTAEATNRSAQFGFRSTNTNGSGVAVFSVFGYNALMMVGADSSTNAVIYSGGGTNNEVMTLIRDGATEFARPIRFSTNASTRPATNAPANTTNVAAWVEFRIGSNSYRAPLYQ
jgi:hypothetical protein